ncbi:MAG: hypothetical protein ACO4CG_13410 [Prochlorothrix sp.]
MPPTPLLCQRDPVLRHLSKDNWADTDRSLDWNRPNQLPCVVQHLKPQADRRS